MDSRDDVLQISWYIFPWDITLFLSFYQCTMYSAYSGRYYTKRFFMQTPWKVHGNLIKRWVPMTEQMDQKHDVPIMSLMGTVFKNTPKMSNLTLLCFLTQNSNNRWSLRYQCCKARLFEIFSNILLEWRR